MNSIEGSVLPPASILKFAFVKFFLWRIHSYDLKMGVFCKVILAGRTDLNRRTPQNPRNAPKCPLKTRVLRPSINEGRRGSTRLPFTSHPYSSELFRPPPWISGLLRPIAGLVAQPTPSCCAKEPDPTPIFTKILVQPIYIPFHPNERFIPPYWTYCRIPFRFFLDVRVCSG